MRIEQVNFGLICFGLVFSALAATVPSDGWFEGYFAFIDRASQFLYLFLHFLAVAALLKYLYSDSSA